MRVEQRAAREHVAEAARTIGVADEEVSGHADAGRGHVETARDFEHHDREGDRDPEPALQHVVEERVRGIVVALDVATESLDREQQPPDAVEVGRVAGGRERVEPARPVREIECRVHVRGDEQRGKVERRLGLDVTDERRETSRDVHMPILVGLASFALPDASAPTSAGSRATRPLRWELSRTRRWCSPIR